MLIGETRIVDLGHTRPAEPALVAFHPAEDDVSGGNTSFRNEAKATLQWKGNPDDNGFGYFQRNRDLGQTFWVPSGLSVQVRALTLRTGRGTNAVMAGAPGALVYVQWFEVGRTPGESLRIHDNGTPLGTRAKHGYDLELSRCDDYVVGDTYTPVHRSTPAPFPAIPATTHDGYLSENRQPGHLRYFQFQFAEQDQVTLQGGRQYAFLVGFESPGTRAGVGLANQQWNGLAEEPAFLLDANGLPWWGVRREGNGLRPPSMSSSPTPPTDPQELERHYVQALFAPRHWDSLRPTTEGYPDVDTYRTLEFALLARRL